MASKGNRRYTPIEKYPAYNDHYDLLMQQSTVFNTESVANAHSTLWDRKNIEVEIHQYLGDTDGFFRRGDTVFTAYIQAAKKRLNDIHKAFEEYKVEKLNQGFDEPSDEDWPDTLLIRRHIAEAILDVRIKELDELQKRFKKFTDEDQKVKDDNILKNGLLCAGKLRDGDLVLLDGQTIIKKKLEGNKFVFIISDGPYTGMSVTDYRKLSEIWKKQKQEEAEQELINTQKRAREIGVPVPQSAQSFYGQNVNKDTLPQFPADFKNWLKDEDTSD